MSKIIPQKTQASIRHKDIYCDKEQNLCENDAKGIHVVDIPKNILVKEKVKKIEPRNKTKIKTINKRTDNEEKLQRNKTKNKKENHLCQLNDNMNNDKKDRKANLRRKSYKKVETKEKCIKSKVTASKKPKHAEKKIYINKKVNNNISQDPLLSRFEKATDSLKQRCYMLSKEVEDLLSYQKKRKQKVVVNETVQYSNIIRDNKNVSVRKKVAQIVLHDYVPLPPRFSPCTFDNRAWDGLKKNSCKSSYDLVKTILKTQQTIDHVTNNVTHEGMSNLMGINAVSPIRPSCSSDVHCDSKIPLFPRLTYDSHINRLIHFNVHETMDNNFNKHFITTQSKDNFVIPSNTQKNRKRYKSNVREIIDFKQKKQNEKTKSIFDIQHTWDFQQESVAIDCSTTSNDHLNRSWGRKESVLNNRMDSDYHLTYTLKKQNCHEPLPHNYNFFDETYTLDDLCIIPNSYNHESNEGSPQNLKTDRCDRNYPRHSNNDTIQHTTNPINTADNVNVVFVSESQECLIQGTSINIEPIEICEVVHSQDVEIIEHSIRQNNDSLSNDEFPINTPLLNKDAFTSARGNSIENTIKGVVNSSHHFCNQQTIDKITTSCGRGKNISIENSTIPLPKSENNAMSGDNFTIRNRLRFIPKGS